MARVAEFIHGARLVSMLMTRRGILCGFLGNERMERMGRAAAALYRLRRAVSSLRAGIGCPIIAVEWSKSANYAGEK